MRMRFLFPLLFLAGCQSAALTAAKLYLQDGDLPRARTQLRRAAAASPEDPEIHFLLGRIAATERDYAAMDSAFQTSWRLGTKFHDQIEQLRQQHWAREYNNGVGYVQSPPPNYRAALHAFGNAVIIDPRPLKPWHNIAHIYHRLDSLDTAVSVYSHVLASVPADTSSLAGLSAIYLEQEHYAQAVQTLTRLLEVAPDNITAHINLGMAHEHLDRDTQAEASYRSAIRLDPRNHLAHYNLGNIYWNRADYPAAREAYEQALALDPDDTNTRYNLAITCISLNDLDRALVLLRELALALPDDAAIWRELSRVYAGKGMVEESRHALERVRDLNPEQ